MSLVKFNKKTSSTSIDPKHNFDNITVEECHNIYEKIKANLPIKNPNTGAKINYDSPITRKLLQTCYTKHKMKKLKDVIDIDSLFSPDKPPVWSPSSSSSSSGSPTSSSSSNTAGVKIPKSPMGAAVNAKSPISPMGAAVNAKSPIKKIDYSLIKISTETKKISAYKNIKEDNCKVIVRNLNDDSEIINPKTGFTLSKMSGITKYILQNCHKKYGNIKGIPDKNGVIDSKGLEDIVDVKTLYDDDDDKSANTIIVTTYDEIYNKFNDLYQNYTDNKLIGLLKECDLIDMDITLFLNFIASCENIGTNGTININTLALHLKTIFDLFTFDTRNYVIFYDEKFLHDVNYLISNNYIKENIKPGNGFTSACLDYAKNYKNILEEKLTSKDILFNTIFNRIYIFNVNTGGLIFKPEDNIYMSDIDELRGIVLTHNKTFPKYFSYCPTGKSIYKKLNGLTAFLNSFSQDIRGDIEIIDPESYKIFNFIRPYYPIKEEYETLTSIMLNNTSFIKKSINTRILTSNFIGTLGKSVLDAHSYLFDLINIQRFKITKPILVKIGNAYKNYGEKPYSTILNIEFSAFFTDPNNTVSEEVQDRLLKMFDYLTCEKQDINKTLYVFHGTKSKLNGPIVSSFLSTSLNVNVAIAYAAMSLNSFIYIFRIPPNMDYINLNDNLQQILLLPGTVIKEHPIIPNQSGTIFILCDIEMPLQPNYTKELVDKLKVNNSKYKILSFMYTLNDKLKKLSIITNNISEYNNKTLFRNNIYTTGSYLFCNLLLESCKQNKVFLNLKYTIHQLVINSIYCHLQPDNTIKYHLMNFQNGSILTGWNYDPMLKSTINNPDYQYDFNLILADILCGNVDLDNNLSYVMTPDNKIKRIWFKTCGLFDGNANQKIFINDKPNLPLMFMNTIITIIMSQNIYNKNTKDDINKCLKENIKKIKKFKNNNVLDVILTDVFHLTQILNIPIDSEEYKELKEMVSTLTMYFTHNMDYIIKNINDITDAINNQIDANNIALGGDNTKNTRMLISKPVSKSKIANNLYANTNTTSYDKDGYELAPRGYSSMTTVSVEAFNAIYKKHYK